MHTEFLIVGQGIAGSLMAWFLNQSKKDFLVIDRGFASASNIAAGIINPVTGKRLVQSWKIKELLPFAEKTYREMESRFNVRLFFQKDILKFFSNDEDLRFFQEKKELDELGEFIIQLERNDNAEPISNKRGGIRIRQAFHLDFSMLTSTIRDWLLNEGKLIQQPFRFEKLILGQPAHYSNVTAEKIIFCEGSNAINNPYFNWLPFNLAKGEILTVRINEFPEDKIFNKGIFILPVGSGIFKVGSTYQWDYKDDEPTQDKRNELEERLRSIINRPFEVINHESAIRPTVKDRRPFLGAHPIHHELFVFNGLGTKGASLAPYFANQLTNHLLFNSPLDKEADIKRFITIFPEKI